MSDGLIGKVEDSVNVVLDRVFGRVLVKDGKRSKPYMEPRLRFYIRDSNRMGRHEGSATIYKGAEPYGSARLEWAFPSPSARVSVEFMNASDEDVVFSLAIPPIETFLMFNSEPSKKIVRLINKIAGEHGIDGDNRSLELAIHHEVLWWSIWGKTGSWSSTDPRWQKGSVNINPLNRLFGEMEMSEEVLITQDVMVPMVEESYPASIVISERTFKRPCLPYFKSVKRYATVDMAKPIPHPGKGTTGYNCGPDALYGLSCEASTVEEAIGKVVACVLDSRKRYPL